MCGYTIIDLLKLKSYKILSACRDISCVDNLVTYYRVRYNL